MSKKPHAQIPVVASGDPGDFNQHRRMVERVVDGLSAAEREIVLNKRRTTVEIGAKPPEGSAAYWDSSSNTVHLFTDAPEPKYPVFLKPLIKHFPFLAAHEIHHPLVHDIRHPSGRYDAGFKRAHRQAVVALHKDKAIGQKIDDATRAIRRHTSFGAPEEEYLAIDYGWKKIDPKNREQLGVLLGVLLSDEYNEISSYTLQPFGRGRSDVRYEEMLCNVKALAHVFGEEKVREFAGGLLDYIEKRTPQPEAEPVKKSSHVQRAQSLRGSGAVIS